jgi:phosphatidylglycerophosphatase A
MKKDIVSFIATGFYTGLLPRAPGTFGTLAAVILFLFAGMNPLIFYSTLFLVVIVSVPTASIMEKRLKKKDPQVVTIDEVAGFLVSVVSFPSPLSQMTGQSWIVLGSAFILFRFFDILKPFPIGISQKLKGGWGIVIDDILAGIYTNLILQLIFRIILYKF